MLNSAGYLQTSLVILLTLIVPLYAQRTDQKPPAPDLPYEMEATERDALKRVENLLSKGEFEEAVRKLEKLIVPNPVYFFVNWTPVPQFLQSDYRIALLEAIETWNQLLAGSIRFEQTTDLEKAQVVILFEWDVVNTQRNQIELVCQKTEMNFVLKSNGVEPKGRTAYLRLSLYVPYTQNFHSKESITHLVGQALGGYLGLSLTMKDGKIMSPDFHNGQEVIRPTEEEANYVRQFHQVRIQLMDYARRRIALYLPKPSVTIEPTEANAGRLMQGENAHFIFKIKNSGDAPLEISARPDCGCVVPKYDRIVEPGKEGQLEAEMYTAGRQGKVTKKIEVTTNDPDRPQIILNLSADIVSVIEVSPPSNKIVYLNEDQPTTHEFTISFNIQEPVQIDRVVASAPYISTKVEPMPTKSNAYKLLVQIHPDAPDGRSTVVITLHTNHVLHSQVPITIICEKGFVVIPNVMLFQIAPNTPLPIKRSVTLVKHGGSFQILKLTSDDPNLKLEAKPTPDKQGYEIIATYEGGWPSELIRRKIIVETDDPKRPRVEIFVVANFLRQAIQTRERKE